MKRYDSSMSWPLRQRHFPGLSLLALVGLLAAACSGSSGTPTERTPTGPTPIELTPTEVTPAEASEQTACTSDAECVIGARGDCCASSGPSCARAWSRRAWEANRAQCAVVECERVKQLMCDGEEREWKAVCNAGTCRLQ
jgi:hypothetical protein